jgi:hypothetical protein
MFESAFVHEGPPRCFTFHIQHRGAEPQNGTATAQQEDIGMMNHASRGGFAALAIGAVVALAAPAHADDAGYLAWLADHGVTAPLPNGTSLLSMGTQDCAALRGGKSERFLIGELEKETGRAQSEDIVVAAHRYLCPDA